MSPPLLLALDSSTPTLALAVGEVQGAGIAWRAERALPDQKQAAVALPLAIDALLAEAGKSVADLGAVAVGLGPGSFTGLRVGIATAKGLCYARRIPLVGASSLQAVARAGLRAGAKAPVAAVLDARHGEVYAGVFEGDADQPRAVGAELSCLPEALADRLGERHRTVTLVGAGVEIYHPGLAPHFAPSQLGPSLLPSAADVAALCLPLPAFSLEALFRLEPSYVRASDAEIQFPQGTFRPRGG